MLLRFMRYVWPAAALADVGSQVASIPSLSFGLSQLRLSDHVPGVPVDAEVPVDHLPDCSPWSSAKQLAFLVSISDHVPGLVLRYLPS